MTIQGGTFKSTQGYALFGAAHTKDADGNDLLVKASLLKKLPILGGMFESASGKDVIKLNQTTVDNKATNLSITGGKYNQKLNESYVSSPFKVVQDNSLWSVAKEVPNAQVTVTKDATGVITKIDTTGSTTIATPTQATGASSVDLKLKTTSGETGDIITLTPVSGTQLEVNGNGAVTGKIATAVIKPKEIANPNGQTTKLELITTDIEKVFGDSYILDITNEPKAEDMGTKTPDIIAGFSVKLEGFNLHSAKLEIKNIFAGSKIPQLWHAKSGQHIIVPSTYSGNTVTGTATGFSSYYVTLTATASSVSSGGNTNNAFRVLFDTQGGSYVSPATGLSAGDKITCTGQPGQKRLQLRRLVQG